MNINIGELNKRIKIISVTSTKDDDGFPKDKIETVFHECWAKITQTSGTELIKANAEMTDVKTRFLIRYTPKLINEDMQILFQGRYYDIVYVNNYEFSNEFIEIFTDKKELI